MTADATPTIRVSAVVLRDTDGRVLTVRKRGTDRFMLPGGKPEPGETPEQAAVREAAEEVGALLDSARLVPLGRLRAAAANEDGYEVVADVFGHPSVPIAGPSAEIAQFRWQAIDEEPLPADLAPLLRTRVFPVLQAAERTMTATNAGGGHRRDQ